VVGDRGKLSSRSFVYEDVQIGEGVFVGHAVTLINDR
jgi:UDP-3-O-[3-hydroxymyristoyl] glucosamine N-acyltransferase